ncbi:MAG: ferrochelatase [Alphaproteobacteria bacterium]
MSRIAVVLFNLGGPDSLDAVRPFLQNLFSDPAIIRVPGPVRWFLARLIAYRRAPIARAIYEKMGGRSPILPETRAQAAALAEALATSAPEHTWHVAVAMRYWYPFAAEAAREVAAFAPDRVVLLPLYPQYSTTTTASSFADWFAAADAAAIDAPTTRVCCYPTNPGFITTVANAVAKALVEARAAAPGVPVRVLFSAHGLPKKVIVAGDPYQTQVEMSVAAVRRALDRDGHLDGADVVTCYQSRVGPLEWIGPATDAEIERAGRAGAAVVVVPIAFVSEHSETLVELDIEYRHLAERAGAAAYIRVPAVGTAPPFIAGLARIAVTASQGGDVVSGSQNSVLSRTCPEDQKGCGGPNAVSVSK